MEGGEVEATSLKVDEHGEKKEGAVQRDQTHETGKKNF